MLGGMVTVFLAAAGLPLPVAAFLAVAASIGVGLLLWAFAIEPAKGASAVTLIIITIGASIFLRGLAQVVFDRKFHSLPPIGGDAPVTIGGASVLPQTFWVLGGSVAVVILLWIFIERTLLGKAIVATAANRLAARLVGVNTARVVGLSFALSAAIGALAGILVTPVTLTQLRCGHAPCAQGVRRGHARRHGQSGGCHRWRASRRPHGGVRCRPDLFGLQGRVRLHRHPRGAVLPASRALRAPKRGTGLIHG